MRLGATILATTFTVKAAGEIVRKVIEVLAEALSDPKKLSELSKQLQALGENRKKGLADDCRVALHRLIAAFPALRICTLDSLFVRIAMTEALRLGMPMEFDVVESGRHAELTGRALDLALEQRLSGKDGVEALMRLVQAIEKGKARRSPWESLRELTGKPYDFFQDANPAAWYRLQTPPAIDERKLRETIDALKSFTGDAAISKGVGEDLARFDAQQWDKFIGTGVAKKVAEGEEKYNRKVIPPHVRTLIQVLLDQAKHHLIGQIATKNEAIHTFLQDFDAQYGQVKRRERSYTFGDLPILLARANFNPFLSQGVPIEHVLLDEFQDTSVSQWRALRPVLGDLRGKSGRSFFCVGNVKQAIYGWRGGSAELFAKVVEEIAGLQQTSLEVSWRSSPDIIGFVNAVFRDIEHNAALTSFPSATRAWQQAFKEHSAQKKERGYVRIETAPAPGKESERRLVTLKHAAGKVKALHEQAPSRSIGILTRTNEAVARLIFELNELGIRASEEGGVPLTDSAAVLVVLSALTLADHPSDQAAAFNVRCSPLAQVIGLKPKGDEGRVAREIRTELLRYGYGRVIARWVESLAPHCDTRNLVRLKHLERLAFRQPPAQLVRPGEFAEFIRTQRVEDPSSSLVRVMTIHKAKGLEFDVVLLPDLDRNLVGGPSLMVAARPAPAEPFSFVSSYASDAVRRFLTKDIQDAFTNHQNAIASEALCNLYVAITRPRYALHIIMAPSKDNERSLPKTYAGVLRAALSATGAMGPDKLIYESGEAAWDRERSRSPAEPLLPGLGGDEPEPERAPKKEAEPLLRSNRTRFFPRTTPSALAAATLASVSVKSLFDVSRSPGLERGTAIHALFQKIGWLNEGLPSDQELTQALPPESRADATRFLADFHAMQALPAIQERLSQAFYQKDWSELCKGRSLELRLFRELPFTHLESGQLISGQIDRLVVGYAGGKPVAAEILDYKTDLGEPVELAEHYAPQMQAYRTSAMRLTGLAENQVVSNLALLQKGLVVRS